MSEELVPTQLLGDLRTLIDGARERAAAAVNQELVLLYWEVGRRIHVDLMEAERGGYGEQIVVTVSRLSDRTDDASDVAWPRGGLFVGSQAGIVAATVGAPPASPGLRVIDSWARGRTPKQ